MSQFYPNIDKVDISVKGTFHSICVGTGQTDAKKNAKFGCLAKVSSVRSVKTWQK